MSQSRVALVVLFFVALLVPSSPAQASSSLVCTGYASCQERGYSHGGYESHRGTSYWNMYTGTNCTNYVAYRLVSTNGMPNQRPRSGVGNARDWGTAMSSITDSRPVAGSVAWWGRTGNHVAYVEKVVSATEIWVSESNWAGAFDWRRITATGSGWPDGFIHFSDPLIVNSTKPAILGTVKVGSPLKASGGVWSPKGNEYSYQWLANGRAISGANEKTFTPVGSQVDKDLAVTVTAERPSFPTAKATSGAVEVAPGTLRAEQLPQVSGTARVDATLTATPGAWSPAASYTYQWLVDGAKVDGATTTSFTPGPEHVGRPVSVRVRAAKGGYTAVAAVSDATTPLAPGPLTSTARPAVTGTPAVGQKLSASTGSWSRSGLTYAYQWFVAGRKIEGATESSYVPRPADLDRYVTVHVTASRSGYTTTRANSAPTAEVERGTLALGSRATISGTARVGSALTATTGTWSPAAAYTFQWYADGRAIAGATQQAFTPTPRELGTKLRVRVTARRDGYTTAATQSVNTAAVAAGRIQVTSPATITGSARLGSVLTVLPGDHTPAGAGLRYQWLRDGEKIDGATASTRRVRAGDLGHTLSAIVTLSADGYTKRYLTTAATPRATATSVIRLSATKPAAGQVRFTIRVAADGVAAPDGTITVRYASTRSRTVTVTDGRATLSLTGQASGERTYRFTFGGTDTVAPASRSKTVTIG